MKNSQTRFWLLIYLAIECAVLTSLLVQRGIFYHVGLDFLPSYAGAQMLLDGGRKDLYDTFFQWQHQQPILNDYGTAWTDRMLQPYVAPPTLALLTVPLLILPPLFAWIAWSGANLAAAIAAVVVLVRRLKIEASTVAFIILASFPLFYTILLGQVEGILLLAMAIFILELRRGNEIRAALALSVLALKPQLLIAPIVFLVATGHRRAFLTTMAAGAVQLAVSVLVVGVSGMQEYIRFGRRLSQPEGIAATNVPGMVNLRALAVRAFPDGETPLVNATIMICSIALLCLAAYLWRRMGREALAGTGCALLMTTTLLTAYHALYHTAIFAALAAVFLIEHAQREHDLAGVDRVIGVSWIFFSFGPFLPFLVVQSSRVPAMISTLGLLIFWGMALRGSLALLPAPRTGDRINKPGAEVGRR